MEKKPSIITEFLIANNAPSPLGGITHWILRDDETLTSTAKHIPLDNPMWMDRVGEELGVVVMSDTEHYSAYSFQNGQKIGKDIPTLGRVVCHFIGDGEDYYFANYGDGSVTHTSAEASVKADHESLYPDIPCGSNQTRQERSHVHQCILSPDKQFVLVCDLGLDSVFVYDRQLNFISRASVPPGNGARHSIFSPDGTMLYTLSEMGGTVTAFHWQNGILTDPVTVDIKPAGSQGKHNDSAAIALSTDGRHLYATNRFLNTICHCIIGDNGIPCPFSQTECDGDHPRDFRLIANGSYAVCTNTFSDTITLYRVEHNGELTQLETVEAGKNPLCILECEKGQFLSQSR